jgi:hypothetical protein
MSARVHEMAVDRALKSPAERARVIAEYNRQAKADRRAAVLERRSEA